MTAQEFSDNFDTLLNSFGNSYTKGLENLGSHETIVLDEYEKSVFLNTAQDNIVKSYYSGKNVYGEGFESTEEVKRYLDSLIKVSECILSNSTTALNNFTKEATLPNDLWFIVYEGIGVYGTSLTEVIPTTYDSFNRIKENPFKKSTSKRVLRIDKGSGKVDLIFSAEPTNTKKYIVGYLKRPTSIDLINGTSCSLHTALHRVILEEAVRLALQSKGISIK